MRNHRPSFNIFLSEIISDNFPEFNFITEPQFQELKYPCIVVHYGTLSKSNILDFWETEVQIDIVSNEFQRELCDRVTAGLLTQLELNKDAPGSKRRFPKFKFFDETGRRLPDPQNLNSDVLYYLVDDIQTIYEPDYPELIHNTFSLHLWFKDN